MVPEPVITDALEVLTTTRAVRRRLDLTRPIPREIVDRCIDVAVQAPVGGNRRGFRFVAVTDPDVRRQLGDVYWQAFEVYRAGPTVATKAFEGEEAKSVVQDRIFESVEHLARNIADVPCLVVACAPGRWETRTNTRGHAGFWGSVFPAVWSFQLACRMYGLGTALTTMHLEFEEQTAEILGIPMDQYTQVGLLPVAYTVGKDFRPAEREPADHFLHWDHWAELAARVARWSDTPTTNNQRIGRSPLVD